MISFSRLCTFSTRSNVVLPRFTSRSFANATTPLLKEKKENTPTFAEQPKQKQTFSEQSKQKQTFAEQPKQKQTFAEQPKQKQTFSEQPKQKQTSATEKVKQEFNIQGQRAVVKPAETLDQIKQSISRLCDNEISQVKEMDSKLFSSIKDNPFLERSGFKLVVNDEGLVTLTKEIGSQVVRVIFDPMEEKPGAEENFEDEEEQVAESEEEKAEHPLAKKHRLEMDVEYKDKSGNPIGRMFLSGFAGVDDRLYITDMASTLGESENPPSQSFAFNEFTQDFQDRVYDYLDEIGIDDKLAHYVRQYIFAQGATSTIDFFSHLKKFMSS